MTFFDEGKTIPPAELLAHKRLTLPIGSDLRVAIHEASHGVALHEFCGLTPELLTIKPTKNRPGAMRPKPPWDHLPKVAVSEHEIDGFIKCIAVYYAGAVAVSLFADTHYENDEDEPGLDAGFQRDEQTINELSWRAAGGDNGAVDPNSIRDISCALTRELLKNRKETIWKIAHCLQQCRTLTAIDLTDVFKAQ